MVTRTIWSNELIQIGACSASCLPGSNDGGDRPRPARHSPPGWAIYTVARAACLPFRRPSSKLPPDYNGCELLMSPRDWSGWIADARVRLLISPSPTPTAATTAASVVMPVAAPCVFHLSIVIHVPDILSRLASASAANEQSVVPKPMRVDRDTC
ncbi:hypothetical protein CALVIDRAFT_533279 [Calocera viscosa TUFC12733]|uniref:Uncharacterized protein n=1 Tax=Calocera viscosa (strain TUFC12733) TaxID=1330018 RepID=A0A167RIZ7_CALVF|nr:hypothetical protein CALVIDRAFT_533279 [Calocera viscosa TUFC12733]